ncbi:MAG: hypothetical protein VX963_10775 [Actinomycetota bacterium]|nr:hypothetical protein [Actinomycetota bacterium]MEC9058079.1 hypothetical protein [Actinomycetota bacterium]
MSYTIVLGTVGGGLWVGYNGGEKWRQIQGPMDPESNVRALAVDPRDSQHLLASVDGDGIYQSHDGGSRWEQTTELTDRPIWSLAFDPHDPERVYAGTRPGLFASDDGGKSFVELDTTISDTCPIGVPRTTNVVVDPNDPATIYASVEVDGLHRSRDRGATWESLGALGPSEFYNDVHGFAVRQNGDHTELLITSPFGLGRSNDEGDNWDWHEFQPFEGSKFEFAYSRCIRTPWEDDTVIVCVGDYIPGQTGAIEVSKDGGKSFQRAQLPDTPKATMYWLATHEELPGVIAATSVYGQIYVSGDYCETWDKLDRELGEIRASLLVPS